MPLIAAVTPHQAEGRWARRGGERVCPPRLALREQGPTLFFPSQRVFLAKVGRLVASRGGGWGGVAPWATCPPLLLPGPFPSCGAGSGSGWKMRPKAAPGAEGGRPGIELGT